MSFSLLSQVLSDVIAVHQSIEDRSDFLEYRRYLLKTHKDANNNIKKVAFDTRRINQESEYNPRRNLQFYHRSEQFLNAETEDKIKTLLKVKGVADNIKLRLGNEPEWFDSYTRVLSNALDRTLRTEQQDGDFSLAQINYINELLYMRYRLPEEQLKTISEQELEKIILNKDEILSKKDVFAELSNFSPKKTGLLPTKQSYTEHIIKTTDNSVSMIEKLLSEVKATKDNRKVKRTVSITVDDEICADDIKKES